MGAGDGGVGAGCPAAGAVEPQERVGPGHVMDKHQVPCKGCLFSISVRHTTY